MDRRLIQIALGLVLAATLASCGTEIRLPRIVDREPQADDRRVRIDELTQNDDKRTVHLSFTGGPPFDLADACSTDYVAVGEVRDDVLEVAVIETVTMGEGMPEQSVDAVPLIVCPAVGHPWTLELELDAPFLGSTVRDLAGYVLFVSAPDGLVELAGLPPDWTLRSENDVEESPTGRWRRRYAPSEDAQGEGNRGALDLYQAFGGPVNVSGGEEQRSVEVGGATGTLFRQAPPGELVLVWTLDGIRLALVANEADFPEAALIELAESAVPPAP